MMTSLPNTDRIKFIRVMIVSFSDRIKFIGVMIVSFIEQFYGRDLIHTVVSEVKVLY